MLNLRDLDDWTRAYMREEIEADIAAEALYEGKRLTERGRSEYPTHLLAAVDAGNDTTLAAELASGGRLKTHETATRKGKTYTKKVPDNAHETLAEGEFNRFYARGVARRAIAEGDGQVRVYRAKEVSSPRPESEAMLGELVDAEALLADLRNHQGVEPALGIPPGPNSGLSVELP